MERAKEAEATGDVCMSGQPKLSPAQLRFLEAAYRFDEQYPGAYFSWHMFGRMYKTAHVLERLGMIWSLRSDISFYRLTVAGRELIERHIAEREQKGART